jgi:hypothetical protein
MLIFYFSGHGDDEVLHMPRGNLPLAQLRSELARVPADLRITFLDACRTGGRGKGVHRGPAFALTTTPDEPHGTVEMRASAVGEAAQESEELAGAVFTHFLLSGLRGAADADGDRRVTFAELYAYSYRSTLLRTGSATVLQHPSLDVTLAGAGEVVLSRTAAAAAFIETPGGGDHYLVFAMPAAAVMGEISGGEVRSLALPAGKFLVVRRGPNRTSVASVDLSWGGTRRLGSADFRPLAREELVARGGRLELRPWRIAPLAGVELAIGAAEQPALRAGVAFAYNRGALGFELEVAYTSGAVVTTGLSGWEHGVAGSPMLVGRLFRGRLTLEGLMGLDARYSWERLTRAEASRVVAAGLNPTEHRSFGALGPRVGARLGVSMGHNVIAMAAGSFSALFRPEEGSAGPTGLAFHPLFVLTVGVGYAF